MDCAVDATDRLSFVTDVSVDGCKAKSWKSGTADTVAAVAWPDTEVAGGLGPELADCSFVFQTVDIIHYYRPIRKTK